MTYVNRTYIVFAMKVIRVLHYHAVLFVGHTHRHSHHEKQSPNAKRKLKKKKNHQLDYHQV